MNQPPLANDTRPGYLLVLGRITDLAKIGAYSKALPTIYAQHAGSYLAIGGPGRGVDWLDGPHRDRSLVLARFPSAGAVQQFWWSREYRDAARLRAGAGAFNVVAVEGLAAEAVRDGGAYLISCTLVLDLHGYEVWRDAFAIAVRAAGGALLADAATTAAQSLEGDPTWDRLAIAWLPTADAAHAIVGDLRESQHRGGVAFVACAPAVAPQR